MSGWLIPELQDVPVNATIPSTTGTGWESGEPQSVSYDEMEKQWAAEDAKKKKAAAKKAKERDPDYQIEPRDLAKEAAIFGKLDATDQRLAMEALNKVKVTATGQNVPKSMNSFERDDLFWLLRENLKLCHYVTPTPVQQACIPVVTAGRDLMASAQTGSGKTAAFVIPIMNVMLQGGPCDVAPEIEDDRLVTVYPLVLVLEPTRELAIQVYEESKKFGYRSWIRARVVYGGVSLDRQVDQLKGRGVDLLIATPGRLQDLINRNFINLSKVRCLVLDEADRMLDMGFEPAVRQLMDTDMPSSDEGRQTLLFSATFPTRIERMSQTFLQNPVRVKVGSVGSVATTIRQNFIPVSSGGKDEALLALLPNTLPGRVLVFTDSKDGAARLEQMIRDQLQIGAGSIHGAKDQWSREEALRAFKSGEIEVLCATSVAARGLDINNVTHVINYDIPKDDDEYVHRIGRTGRVGKEGESTSLFLPARDCCAVARLVKKEAVPVESLKGLKDLQRKEIRRLVEGPEANLYMTNTSNRGGGGFRRGFPRRG